jgi:GT2 family glycosyltransferase
LGPDRTEPTALADDVTLVVVTRNRWPDLLRSLPHHQVPVVVVDNASNDGTTEHVRQFFPHVRVITLPVNRGAAARNIGVLHAATPFVAFADDDSWWAPGALDLAVSLLQRHERLGLLSARVLVGQEQIEDPVCRLMSESILGIAGDLPGPSVLGFLACGAVVRRTAFVAADGFDDVIFFGGEEERLALDLASLGWGICYVPEVVAHHFPSTERDQRGREALLARNRLLTLVLRRPWRVVLAAVVNLLRAGTVGRRAVREVAPRLPKAMWRRRLLPPDVEAAQVALDEAKSATRSATTRKVGQSSSAHGAGALPQPSPVTVEQQPHENHAHTQAEMQPVVRPVDGDKVGGMLTGNDQPVQPQDQVDGTAADEKRSRS